MEQNFMKDNEELIKQISSQITAEIAKQKKEGVTEPSELNAASEAKLQAMISDQLEQLNLLNAKRKSEFDVNYEKSKLFEEDAAGTNQKALDEMNFKERKALQEKRILFQQKSLSAKFGNDMADKIEKFKQLNDDAYLISTMLFLAGQKKGFHQSFVDVYRSTESYKDIHRFLAKDSDLRKAMAVGNTGYGAEWIPTGFSTQLLKTIELNLRVAALFNSIQMPTNPYKMPVQISNAEGYLIAENTADSGTKIAASTPGTTSPEFSAIKLAGRVLFSDEISEDAIINMRDFVIGELALSIARAQEQALINGHRTTTALHMDNQAAIKRFSNDTNARRAFDGLRRLALINAGTTEKSFAGGDPTDALMGNVRQLALKYGVMPGDGAWIMGVNTYLKALFTLTNIVTLEKYGPGATVLSGELFKYSGAPVIVSEYLESDLNASGVYDGITTNLSMLLYAHRPSFMVGYRGGITLNSNLDIDTDQIILVAKRRMDFVDPYDATLAGNPQVVAGINVKTT